MFTEMLLNLSHEKVKTFGFSAVPHEASLLCYLHVGLALECISANFVKEQMPDTST